MPTAHEREQAERLRRIVALRADGQTWAEVAEGVGLSPSRVRALYAQYTRSPARPDDAAILANLRAFLAQCERREGQPSRRAYGAWPGRLVTPTTVESRFKTWANAIAASGE